MSLSHKIRTGALGLAATGALALGASSFAGAASTSTATTPATDAAQSSSAPAQRPDPTRAGGHVGANGQTEQALPADVAAKVREAALAKVPGATLERVETDVDHGSPYEAHLRKADGTELEVLVDRGFNVTAVNTMQHP